MTKLRKILTGRAAQIGEVTDSCKTILGKREIQTPLRSPKE